MNIEKFINGENGDKLFLLGNEAAVRGIMEAGVSIASTYPGTPSSEIGDLLYKIGKDIGIYFEFSVNEKVALEVAAAASISGLRSFVFMKHVGLNVAADSFMTTAYSGVRGGMVIFTADDPSIFSSQNEQDNRRYARIANLPLLEPSNPDEIKEMMKYAYEISEMIQLPVIMRTTTRVSHMRGIVELGDVHENNKGKTWKKGFFDKKDSHLVPVPAAAIGMHKKLVEKMHKLTDNTNTTELNKVIEYNDGSDFGVISSGSASNYAIDIINEDELDIDVLKLGFTYPFPEDKVYNFIKDKKSIFVVEEVDPVMEQEILAIIGKHHLNINVYGKLDGTFPEIYEFTPDIVRRSYNKILKYYEEDDTGIIEKSGLMGDLPIRPPVLCPGCPHRATYYAVGQAAEELGIKYEDLVFPSDIGCYTLGIEPPYLMADYLLSMGSSVGTSGGFSKATNQHVLCYLGDSTFFHAGIAPLINGIHNKHKFVLTVLDNRITAMTGGQPNPGLPVDGMGDEAPQISIEAIAKACGAEFVETVNPMNVKKTIQTFKKALEYDGVAVVVTRYPCMLLKDGHVKRNSMEVNQEKCTGCLECKLDLACPAIILDDDGKVFIDEVQCKGCTVCIQMCKEKAIRGKMR